MNNKRKEENKLRINNQIRVPQVKLVGDNVKMDIYPIQEAIKLADEMGLDLVEINASLTPCICKIMDYQKFLYDKRKNDKKPDKIEIKELRFRPKTDEHDFNFKVKHAQNFLSKGDRLKVVIFFKGREMAYQNQGAELLKKLVDALENYGVPEAIPKMEGTKMLMFFKPKKK
jgi:translation initiation factor IF-3